MSTVVPTVSLATLAVAADVAALVVAHRAEAESLVAFALRA